MHLLLWSIWVVVVIIAAVLFYRWFSRPGRRRAIPEDASGSSDVQPTNFLGGLRWPCRSGVSSVAGPFARLQLFEWGIRAGPSLRVLRVGIPTWEATFAELSSADAVRAPISTEIKGVRFQVASAEPPVVFWTSKGSDVLERLEEKGVPVNRDVVALHLFSNR